MCLRFPGQVWPCPDAKGARVLRFHLASLSTRLTSSRVASSWTSSMQTRCACRPLTKHAVLMVINDSSPVSKARIAEEAGACAVMALERVPADIRTAGGVARMASARLPSSCIMVLEHVPCAVLLLPPFSERPPHDQADRRGRFHSRYGQGANRSLRGGSGSDFPFLTHPPGKESATLIKLNTGLFSPMRRYYKALGSTILTSQRC